ncbi:MAG: hypothetical protein QOC93_2740 [Actinomycetota bacterium]|nr:hypothetical protein [Actinomycetota bacterium]
MESKEFIQAVTERTGLSRQEAADLTRATLGTLAARVSDGELRQLAMQLPDGLREYAKPHKKGTERFGLTEFVRKVSEHTGLTESETTTGVRAVLTTLREAVSADEYRDVMSQLPGAFTELVDAGT